MDILTKEVAKKFCEICDRAYEIWTTQKILFDENQNKKDNINKANASTVRLSEITQEFCLLQISKLHDKPIQRDSLNLTVEFMVRFGDWGAQQEEINKIKIELEELWKHIKPARNKALAHNDLETLMNNDTLGAFPAGKDNDYFNTLQKLVDMVSNKWIGRPYHFNIYAKTDAEEFLELLERAPTGIEQLMHKT